MLILKVLSKVLKKSKKLKMKRINSLAFGDLKSILMMVILDLTLKLSNCVILSDF
jgi:hypothetical protein